MNLLIIITGLLIMQVDSGLHNSTDSVFVLQKQGEYVEALNLYAKDVQPNLVFGTVNQQLNARLVEVLLFRKLGYTQRGLDSLAIIIPEIPDTSTYKMVALSHLANLKYDAIDFTGYYETLNDLYILAKENNDTKRMHRALGNMYWYFEEKNDPEKLDTHISLLEEQLDSFPGAVDSMRYYNLKGRYLRDVKSDFKAAFTAFGNAKDLMNDGISFQWYEIISYEQYTTALKDGNLFLAEQILKDLSTKTGTLQNPNILYPLYSAFVRLYTFKGDIELAKEYWKLMQLIPEESLNKLSIKDGVYAEIALSGSNTWVADPLMKHAKKSGFSDFLLIICIVSAIGLVIAGLGINRLKVERSNLHALSRWSLVE